MPRLRHWTAVALGVLTAAWLHAFHDTLPVMLARLTDRPDAAAGTATRLVAEAVNWLGILVLVAIVLFAWRREARILRAELHDEVRKGIVPADDFATITSFWGRLRRQLALLRSDGVGPMRRMRRRYAAEGELAFHKWQASVRPGGAADPAKGEALRGLIRSLTDSTPEAAS
jgi:hypothetical protein